MSPWEEQEALERGNRHALEINHFLHICLEDQLKRQKTAFKAKETIWLFLTHLHLPKVTSALGEEGSIRQCVQFRGNGICLLEPMTKQGPWSKSLWVFLFFFLLMGHLVGP